MAEPIQGVLRSGLRIKYSSRKLEARGRHALGCSTQVNSDARDQNPLEINAILISDGLEEVLLASIDTMYIGPEIRLHFEEVFKRRLGPHQIVIGASHTHNAPNLDSTKPLLSSVSTEFLNEVKHAVVELARVLEESCWTRVSLTNDKMRFDMGVSRRKAPNQLLRSLRIVGPDFLQLPNATNLTDVSASFLGFWDGQEVVASLCIIPCHPVAYPEQNSISPDFPGYVRSRFRQHRLVNNASSPAFVFFQGASGDLRPPALSKSHPSSLRHFIFRFFYGRPFGRFSKEAYETWSEKIWNLLAEKIEKPKPLSGQGAGPVSCVRVVEPMTILEQGPTSSNRFFSLQFIEFGGFRLLAVSAELTRRMGNRILAETNLQPPPVVATCIDDTFGYIVDSTELSEGGYEVSGWTKSFGIPSSYRPELASETVLDAVRRAIVRQ